jgi:YidC/Oxa1 family membrane protein insertase
VKRVLLKNYTTFDKQPLFLVDESNFESKFRFKANEAEVDLYQLYFDAEAFGKDTAGLRFTLQTPTGERLVQEYELAPKGFLLQYQIKNKGLIASQANKYVELLWTDRLKRLESDVVQQRSTSTINYYYGDGEFSDLGETTTSEVNQTLPENLKWVAFKQKFFNTGIIAKQPIAGGQARTYTNEADSNDIKTLSASFKIPIEQLNAGAAYTIFYGPNRFKVLEEVADGYGKNVYLGWPVIRAINRYVVVNVFSFLEQYTSNYGIIIIILVLLVKLLLFPLSYKSYVGMAKMKVMKPELDEIKERVGDDMQAMQQEQMKLYQQVGINPLSGCIPLLLQLPVLLAMFNFFPNSIELRGESFWWAHDLSTYDNVLNLPFTIPAYGSHVSLFTILMTASTLVLTWYNNQTTTATGPMLTMSYIMPLVFMFVLNSLPAGLSFYYLVSNVVGIGQQQLIKSFVDHDKLKAKLEQNKIKNANKPKSGFAKRLEDMMRAAEEAKKTSETARTKGKKR